MVEMGNLFKAETELIDKIRELMIEMQPKLSPGLKAEVRRTRRPSLGLLGLYSSLRWPRTRMDFRSV